MVYLTRNIDADLLKWKKSPRRKPLLVRGVRQVGKSWAIRHLGETFRHYLEKECYPIGHTKFIGEFWNLGGRGQ